MMRFQLPMPVHRMFGLAVLVVALSACGKADDAAPASTGMQAVVEDAAQDAATAGALPNGDAPLKRGQSVQGTIQSLSLIHI